MEGVKDKEKEEEEEEEEEEEGSISFSEGGRIWQKHFVTGLLVTLQQQKTQTSGQDLLRNRWCDSVHRREWKGERGNGDEGGRRETVGIWK